MKGINTNVAKTLTTDKPSDRLRVIINRILSTGLVKNENGAPVSSQKELAIAIGMTPEGLSMAVNGKTNGVSKALSHRLYSVFPFFSEAWLRLGEGSIMGLPYEEESTDTEFRVYRFTTKGAQSFQEKGHDTVEDYVHSKMISLLALSLAHRELVRATSAAVKENNESDEDKLSLAVREISSMAYKIYKRIHKASSEYNYSLSLRNQEIMETAKDEFGFI